MARVSTSTIVPALWQFHEALVPVRGRNIGAESACSNSFALLLHAAAAVFKSSLTCANTYLFSATQHAASKDELYLWLPSTLPFETLSFKI